VKVTVDKLTPLFNPRSIAVIGASGDLRKAEYIVFRNLVENSKRLLGYKVYPINPYAKRILGVKAYPSITKIEEDIDLAVVVVPAERVPLVLKECGEKHVKVVIILSAGFSEVGNIELEEDKRIGTKFGIRILGPNCLVCLTLIVV